MRVEIRKQKKVHMIEKKGRGIFAKKSEVPLSLYRVHVIIALSDMEHAIATEHNLFAGIADEFVNVLDIERNRILESPVSDVVTTPVPVRLETLCSKDGFAYDFKTVDEAWNKEQHLRNTVLPMIKYQVEIAGTFRPENEETVDTFEL